MSRTYRITSQWKLFLSLPLPSAAVSVMSSCTALSSHCEATQRYLPVSLGRRRHFDVSLVSPGPTGTSYVDSVWCFCPFEEVPQVFQVFCTRPVTFRCRCVSIQHSMAYEIQIPITFHCIIGSHFV